MSELRLRRLWLSIGWGLVAFVLVLSLEPDPPSFGVDFTDMDKVEHFLAYAALMGWFLQIYRDRRTRLLYAAGFIGLGILVEFLQGLSGWRDFQVSDMAADALGVLAALLIGQTALGRVLNGLERLLLPQV